MEIVYKNQSKLKKYRSQSIIIIIRYMQRMNFYDSIENRDNRLHV